MVKRKNSAARLTVCALLTAVMAAGACGAAGISAFAEESADDMYFNKIAEFDTGNTNADGGTAEIVHYNSDNGKMYLVNGADQSIDIISLEAYESGAKTVFDENSDRIYINDIVESNADSFAEGFEVGDIASVAVNTDLDVVAVAVQHSDYAANGAVVLLDYSGNFVAAYQTGVQPDNVVFGGNYLLTADEGEPRKGYAAGTDPKGSVTIVSGLTADNLTGGTSSQVYFDKYDSQRDSLTESGVILMKEADPSVDLEPEYIVTNGTYAYVALQEANAVAILDIKGGDFTAICPLGFKDHSSEGNGLDLINDGKINITTQDVYGVYMPDGMDLYTAEDGTTYLITANEGDAREWGEFTGVTKKTFYDENGENSTKVEVLDNTLWDGIDSDKTYVLGGRSFSVFKVTGTGMEMVYDSGDGIEQTIAASDYSAYFNCNSDDVSLDARSRKKGPEPEDVTVYEYNGKVCVSVCMERQSGFVTFDITDVVSADNTDYTATATSSGYTTTRDFTADMAGDVAPENLEYVAAADNATGKDLIVMANENSGTVAVYAIEDGARTYDMVCDYTKADSTQKAASALITAVYGTGDNTDGAFNYSFITICNNTDSDLDLSGWTIQYKSGANSIDWQAFTLKTVLKAGGTYTVACTGAEGTYANSATLTAANYDAVWTGLAYLDNKDFSVKIADADGNTVDALGVYDKTNSEEGEGTLVSGTSKNKVVTRNTDSETGAYVDTDNNSADFTISGKITTADGAVTYTPAANSGAEATAKVTVNAENASVTGIDYLASGYVLAGDVSFTVTTEGCYAVTAVTVDDTTLTAVDGTYSFALTADCEITVTAALSHTVSHVEAKSATCLESGNTEYWYCTVCGKYFSDEACTTEISAQDTIIMTAGHYYESVVTAPTCTEQGYTTYTCKVCGDSYKDSETDATGHSYSFTKIDWSEDLTSAVVIFTCINDSTHTEVVTATITSKITTAATCTTDGVKTYTATISFGGETYTYTQTETLAAAGHYYESVVTAPTCTEQGYTTYTCNVCGDSYTDSYTEATGHSYNFTKIDWSEDLTSAVVTFTCTNDSTHTEVVTATITSEVTAAATATADGVKTYTATISFGGETYTYTQTQAIPATGDSSATDSSTEGSSTEDSSTEDSSAEDSSSADSSTTESSTTDSSTEGSSTEDSSTEDSGTEDSSAADSSTTESSTTDSSSSNSSSSSSSSSSSKKSGSGCGAVYTGGDGGINGDMGLVISTMALFVAAVIAVRAIKKRR